MPYRFNLHGGYVELELFGVLDILEPFTPREWQSILATRAILYNYDEVDEIRYDPCLTAEALKRMAARGIRFAGYASQPAWFGVNRQLIQIAGASETSVRVDPDRASAVAWLLHRGARPD